LGEEVSQVMHIGHEPELGVCGGGGKIHEIHYGNHALIHNSDITYARNRYNNLLEESCKPIKSRMRSEDTLIRKNFFLLIYKEIQMGSVAKSCMRKGFLIYKEMRKYLVIYEEAVSPTTL
jgi:hypothetical protein